MVRECVNHVMRMKQRLLNEVPDVRIIDGVEKTITVTPHLDDVSHAQLGEMLRDRRRLYAEMFCQFANRVLTVQQSPDDPQTSIVSQDLQRLHRQPEPIIVRRLNSMRIHADSFADLPGKGTPDAHRDLDRPDGHC
jgi:hypothetical protein